MSQIGKIDAEVIKSMIRWIFWAGADALADGTPLRRPHFST
jgi:hypothetical protein